MLGVSAKKAKNCINRGGYRLMPEFPRKDFQLHVGWRTIKTAVSAMLVAIGVIVALLVNYFLPRARVVAFWEGFKGLFRMGSKV